MVRNSYSSHLPNDFFFLFFPNDFLITHCLSTSLKGKFWQKHEWLDFKSLFGKSVNKHYVITYHFQLTMESGEEMTSYDDRLCDPKHTCSAKRQHTA